MTTYIVDKGSREGLTAALGLALVWAIAAAVRPSLTFHLAPILIAGVVPFLRTAKDDGARGIAIAGTLGIAVAVVTGVGLSIFDLLRGPSLLPFGGAFAEAIVFAMIGAGLGVLATLLKTSR
jgi:hypothetical protein